MGSINHEVLNERKEELEEFFGELIDTYLGDATNLIDGVTNAVNNDDADALREAAHALKSSSGFMGADRVVELSADLEAMGRGGEGSAGKAKADELVTELALACAELEKEREPA